MDAIDWPKLVREHVPHVLALCARSDHDPEDAYQEVWARIFRSIGKYDASRGTMGAWIATVTRRFLIDRFRRRRSRGPVISIHDLSVSGRSNPEQTVDRLLIREKLEAAIARLPPDQRHVVLMHHLHGVSLADLATESGLALGTIKSRLHRGRAQLARILRGQK